MKTIRNPPMLLNTPGVCNCDTISYCDTVFLFLASRCERKKNIYHYHHRCKLRAWSFFSFIILAVIRQSILGVRRAHLRVTVPGQHANTALFEMSQRWRAVVNIVFDLTGPRFEHQTSRSKDELVAT